MSLVPYYAEASASSPQVRAPYQSHRLQGREGVEQWWEEKTHQITELILLGHISSVRLNSFTQGFYLKQEPFSVGQVDLFKLKFSDSIINMVHMLYKAFPSALHPY